MITYSSAVFDKISASHMSLALRDYYLCCRNKNFKYFKIPFPLSCIPYPQVEAVRNRGISIIYRKQRVLRREYTRMSQANKHAIHLLDYKLGIK